MKKYSNRYPFRRALTFYAPLLLIPGISRGEGEFNTRFVHGAANVAAVENLARNDGLSEGVFHYDIYLNQQFIENRDVTFKTLNGKPAPCFKASTLVSYGIKIPNTDNQGCYDLVAHIPHSTLMPDSNYQRIDISVPDASMETRAQGAVPSSAWDEGINAAFVGYDVNTTRFEDTQDSNDSVFASLHSGINLAGWHFRNQSTASYASHNKAQWQTLSSWVERNITSLKSRLRVGQLSTTDNVFDSVQFQGVQLTRDMNMLPDSLRGFAPTVRGTAASNATVEIRQNSYLIYSKSVQPGPFRIEDLFASNQSGDLQVTVIEANGSRRAYSIPYSSVPNMQRAGNLDFQVTAGEYRDGVNYYRPRFVQGTLGYGLESGTTLYGGLMAAEHYQSGALGIGQDLGRTGAISVDITTAKTDLASGEHATGQSYRFLYAKSLNDYGTNFHLIGYRYNTAGYYSFSDAVNEHASWHDNYYDLSYDDPDQHTRYIGEERNRIHYYTQRYNNRRDRLEATINQRLWENTSLYLTASNQSYWGSGSRDRTLLLGYNAMWHSLTYSLSLQDTRSQYGYRDRSINLNLSVPFDVMDNRSSVSFNALHSKESGGSYSTNYSTTAFNDQLNWGVQGYSDNHHQQSIGVNAAWQGSKASIRGGYSAGRHYQNLNAGMSGGALFHAGGLTLMPVVSDTMVLVEAKDATGVHVEQQSEVAVDGNGYAVLGSVNPWHYNPVSLDAADIGAGLDIPHASKTIVPMDKAISKVVFETFTGHNYLIRTSLENHTVPPVGANVVDDVGRNHGYMGMNGELYVSGVPDAARLEVRWGARTSEHCFIRVPDTHGKPIKAKGYEQLTARCIAS